MALDAVLPPRRNQPRARAFVRTLFAIFLALVFLPGQAWACHLPKPSGPAILLVKGMIDECNEGFEVHFDMKMLEALPRTQIVTANPWEKTAVTFDGVLLRDLLDHVEADGKVIGITALNDYQAEIDVQDAYAIDVMLAYKRNGAYMAVREKGPLFVVFPFTGNPELETEKRYVQSVWQVSRIVIK